ncbi:MAG: hypothetical protein D6715_04255 [Calditrichaeota bacterium]|nr:MAG: hypothetical protein D6715_04255 [Calditrichota bacterium]
MVWYVSGAFGVLVFVFFVLIWLRKLQYDAVHQNFLDLVDEFGGEVLRGGFAVRPRYRGSYQGRAVSISIYSEKKEKGRAYYITVLMQLKAPATFTILSRQWIGEKPVQNKEQRHLKELVGGAYLLEVSEKESFGRLNIPQLEHLIGKLEPFAYILVAKSRLILERVSSKLIDDTKIEVLKPLLEAMHQFCLVVES